MKMIDASFEIVDIVNGREILKKIEKAARTCYKSEEGITDDSSGAMVRKLLQLGHESVLEHEKISVRIICDRGVSHEIVRHRIASYSQESTRYCNYSDAKFGKEITVIKPCFWRDLDKAQEMAVWRTAIESIEKAYMRLLEMGASPQEARSVLPNSLKTEIVVTMNLREWRLFFRLRTSLQAHPQMREITVPMLADFKKMIPVVFEDIMPE
jgi:thymidylate synthase (FAD)